MDNPFSISDEKLKTILDSYTSWIEKDKREKRYPEQQRKRDEDLRRTLLSKAYLSKTPKKELINKVMEYSRTVEGPAYIQLGLPRLTNEINNIKKNLLYLIESKDDPFKKAANILEGKQKISFFSRSFWSPIFNSLYPKYLPNWNNKTERFLIKLGVNIRRRGLKTEDKYKLISEAFTYLKKLNPSHDFYSINHLMHYGTEIAKGNDLIRKITGEKETPEVSYWRVILPYDRKGVSIWPACRDKELIAIGYPNQPDEFNVQHLKKMRIGDKVVAYLLSGRIGGIGTISGEYEDYSETKPKSKNYFGGYFWRRRKVRWDRLPKEGDYWKLTSPQIVPGARMTIYKMTLDQYNTILEDLDKKEPKGEVAPRFFKGFTKDAFELLNQLEEDTSYESVMPISKKIHEKIVHPLGDLFKDIAHDFDTWDILGLEKEKRIVSHLWEQNPRSGAWPYIWGAFYKRGMSRPTSMQFFIWMNKDHIFHGIYPSMKNFSIREKIIENLKKYGSKLEKYISEDFYKHFSFYTDYGPDEPREFYTVENLNDLIQLYESYPINVGLVMSPKEVISEGRNLVNLIEESFRKLIPLYVFGISDDPISLIQSYLTGISEEEGEEEPIIKEVILKEIFLDEEKFDEIISLLESKRKKQIILQGPPGTGKTFIAERIAKYLAQSKYRIETVQFHASYSYEDFIEGYRPTEDENFKLGKGIFKVFCQTAKINPGKKYVMVIDEINRGSISKIFGELLYLLEYRDKRAKLTYSQEEFSIPENIYLIGTMNTADRSLALMDYALRRRFYFYGLTCQTERLGKWLRENNCRLNVDDLISKIESMNDLICREMKSDDFAIGHSYFMKENLDDRELKRTIEFEIKPLLKEYFFDKKEKIKPILYEIE